MQDIRPQGAWYPVYLDMADGAKPACIDVRKLADILPHGSGIDGSWTIRVLKGGSIRVHGEYHAMDESGYTGWRNFRFTIARAKRNEYRALSGPCEGQYQITRVKGRPYLMSFVGGGDAKDYLYDTCYWPLSDALGVKAIDSFIAHSESQAQSLVA